MPRLLKLILLLLVCHSSAVFSQQSIGIFACACTGKPWDPDSINSGITGSEEAIIYMAQELARLDYKVLVFADPPANSIYSRPDSNPRYISSQADDSAPLDIAIAWRMPNAAAKLKTRAQQVYLWPHDTLHYFLSLPQINAFNDTFWLSKWQRKQFISVSPGFAQFNNFYGNGIVPEQFEEVRERANPYACIYGSNYARGLEILLDIWPEVKKQFPKATLDIYYGWQHWGLLSPEKEAKMRQQVAALAPLEVIDHGLVGHAELNRAYAKASFWTYPCIAPETFCITALRAQLAGAVPVIIEGSALPETVRHGYKCQKPDDYLGTLIKAMQEAEKITVSERKKMGEFVLQEYSWKAVAAKWKKAFDKHTAKE